LQAGTFVGYPRILMQVLDAVVKARLSTGNKDSGIGAHQLQNFKKNCIRFECIIIILTRPKSVVFRHDSFKSNNGAVGLSLQHSPDEAFACLLVFCIKKIFINGFVVGGCETAGKWLNRK
jgi:hypothetical protein